MKKLILILTAILCTGIYASARSPYTHDAAVLPPAARQFLAKHFKGKVSLVKTDKTLGMVDDYEVIMTTGTEVQFDRQGNWENVETSASSQVPPSIVPKPIADYVKSTHKGARIVGIERNKTNYEVELSNGLDLKFNKAGQFLKYDN